MQGTAGCHLHTDGRTHPVLYDILELRVILYDILELRVIMYDILEFETSAEVCRIFSNIMVHPGILGRLLNSTAISDVM